MTDSDMEIPSRVNTTENDRRQSTSSSVFRTPLRRSRSGETSSLKSTPADPQLTETNGQSTSLRKYEECSDKRSTKEHLSNIMIQDQSSFDSQAQSQSNSFFKDMVSTFSSSNNSVTEPEILAHRRENSGTITVSKLRPKSELPVGKPSLPLSELDLYDSKLYVNEFYADTHYRFASDKRNNDFHQLFPKVPASERLLDDFSSALNREFLIQGRVYITPMRVCFNSNLLGWVTSLEIDIKDIVSLEKTSTAGLFPNGICIHLPTEKHYFASFISRDTTFKFLEIIWHTRKELDYLTLRPDQLSLNRSHSLNDFLTGTNSTCPPSRSSFAEADSAIESAIMSVDDSYPTNKSLSNLHEEDGDSAGEDESGDEDDYEEEDDDAEGEKLTSGDDYYYDEEAIASDYEEKSVRRVYKLKKKSKFHYDGPYYFKATEFMYNPEENKETVLAELELNAPPGLVYQLMFSEECPDLILEFLKAQNSSQCSDIPPFDQVNPEGQHYRKYTYAKALNFPVGPKSTKCLVSEHILYCAYDNYINIVNTTKTPDVPSGNSFSVKTRYMYRWKDNTSCVLKISYWVDWTGSSWIKSMIDNSVNSGQVEATEKLLTIVEEFVKNNVEESEMKVNIQPRKSLPQSRRVSKISKKSSKLAVQQPSTPSNLENKVHAALTKENIILSLLFIITLIMMFNTLCQVRILRKLNKLMNTNSASVIEEIKDILNVYNELPMSNEE
ncbi:Lam6p [Kluyveromyces lactis]|uniref:KLLA0D05555p n=1 Tax=Kluyveromyces lactis (strain ATCC 8585 / CBS 2359 / DSM 70799 / NBRC 1267 / NRRL Y-1140 / WM37) TaxID=284590 RepID=Q6CRY1_KLULA|nr:uncharacterized protein KLLA0_D05555g [Kluyveromyces lactis]CAH00404.1 KLLA0D05555p [Kluyveromyces lactis]|eukprot:XP_453308.1 uncharacterized protein KLLA0_D05555g [Kluyveromyces lactis]